MSLKKLLYVVPGAMAQTDLGVKEMERRKSILQDNAGKGFAVDIIDAKVGPSSIESLYEEYLSVPETVKIIVQAEKDGYEGVILGCFGDPGLDAIREMVKIPVVGPGETSMLMAAMLGHRFSVVTVLDTIVPALERLAKITGIESKLASVRAANIPVLDLAKDFEGSKQNMLQEAKKAMDLDRADAIVLGCMSMAFLGVSDKLQEELGIPVINPAVISLKILESLIHSNLTHSKKAYPLPPKLKI